MELAILAVLLALVAGLISAYLVAVTGGLAAVRALAVLEALIF